MSTSGGLDDLLGLGGPSLVDPAPVATIPSTFDPLANLGLGGLSAASPVVPVIPSAAPPALGAYQLFSGLNVLDAGWMTR